METRKTGKVGRELGKEMAKWGKEERQSSQTWDCGPGVGCNGVCRPAGSSTILHSYGSEHSPLRNPLPCSKEKGQDDLSWEAPRAPPHPARSCCARARQLRGAGRAAEHLAPGEQAPHRGLGLDKLAPAHTVLLSHGFIQYVLRGVLIAIMFRKLPLKIVNRCHFGECAPMEQLFLPGSSLQPGSLLIDVF